MGYYANGCGTVEVENMPEELFDRLGAVFDIDLYKNDTDTISSFFVSMDGKYYDDEICEALDLIAPYTIKGNIRFCGEDECNWRFFFDSDAKKWIEENGVVCYPGGYRTIVADRKQLSLTQEQYKSAVAALKELAGAGRTELAWVLDAESAYEEI